MAVFTDSISRVKSSSCCLQLAICIYTGSGIELLARAWAGHTEAEEFVVVSSGRNYLNYGSLCFGFVAQISAALAEKLSGRGGLSGEALTAPYMTPISLWSCL